ncbi:hypothetical protein RFI_10069 [Reticulomyxa filosa]|uniref:Uncharacterized protein n=1 Tax=Reticulomyxa filosa TaxID=46433 RepID=X6NNV8_RETFI|nr:hypothetical protein RFI_10069 [Reticulomyxa filosa]|eukprot:ETO27062.1 hypothetical protein RFI_10069 [Reticulomyxa filosa]
MEIENENSEAKRENNIFRMFQFMSDQGTLEEMKSLQKAKNAMRKLRTYEKLKKDLEDTMEEMSNWSLSIVNELAQSKNGEEWWKENFKRLRLHGKPYRKMQKFSKKGGKNFAFYLNSLDSIFKIFQSIARCTYTFENCIVLGLACYDRLRKNLQQRKITALQKLGDISKEELQKKNHVATFSKNFEKDKEDAMTTVRTLVKTEELTLSKESPTLSDCNIENLSAKEKFELIQILTQASLPEQQEWDNVISNVDKFIEKSNAMSKKIDAHCDTNVYFPFPFSVITFTILYLGYLCIGLIQSFEQKLSTQGIYALLFSSYSSRVPHIITTTHLQKIVISIAECANQLLNISWILGRA